MQLHHTESNVCDINNQHYFLQQLDEVSKCVTCNLSDPVKRFYL